MPVLLWKRVSIGEAGNLFFQFALDRVFRTGQFAADHVPGNLVQFGMIDGVSAEADSRCAQLAHFVPCHTFPAQKGSSSRTDKSGWKVHRRSEPMLP